MGDRSNLKEYMSILNNKYQILQNKPLNKQYYRLSLKVPEDLLKQIKPGQFVHIRVSDSTDPLLRRPFSVCRSKECLEIFYDIVGKGTEILSKKCEGEFLDVFGPLGNGFNFPDKNIKNIIFIAGGIGIAPLINLSDCLKDSTCVKMLAYGARSKEYIYSLDEFKENGFDIKLATDDGNIGVKGTVLDLLKDVSLQEPTFIYACGPKQMLIKTQEFAKQNNINGQISCEEVMACGVGACLGCVVKTSNGMKNVCSDGPVFDLHDVEFG